MVGETLWHRRKGHLTRHISIDHVPDIVTRGNCAANKSSDKQQPIVEHRSGSGQGFASELKTALRSIGGKASPTLGDDGDLCVGERTCSSSLTADSGVRNGALEGSL